MEIEGKKGIQVKILWGKQKFDLVYQRTDDLDTLKANLYSLTNVLPDNQKILIKGKIIKEDAQLKSLDIVDGSQIMLMGTAEGKAMDVEKMMETRVFVEELTPEQRAKYLKENLGTVLPYGLTNLGNTCYLNSTLQVLLKIPELRKEIEARKSAPSSGQGSMLLKGLASVFNQLENSGETVKPMNFVMTFMNIFPQFAEMDKGSFKQQDADECFQGILTTLEPALPAQGGSLIDKLFGFHVRYTWKNTQTTEEPETYTDELLRRLPCIIDNQSHPINQLFEGIKVGLEGEVEKYSPTLESNAVYTKIGKLATLPDYLIVQNIRFIWKDLDTTTRNQAQKAKILRAVTFPKVLDMSDFCVPELQEEFKKIREKIKTSDEQKIKKNEEEFEAYKKSLEKTELDTAKITKQFRESKREQEIKDHDSDLWHDLSKGTPTGNYELIGVITHKGRGADSGHYVGWTHYKGDEWYRYDDDDVTKVKIEDVLALRGGGDWHMAYYLIYRKLVSDL